MIQKAVKRAFEKARQRGWKKLYFAFDIHDTIIKSNYDKSVLPTEIFVEAEYILKTISKRKDIIMILYSCSHPEELEKYVEFFKTKEIYFDHVNENPSIMTDHKGYGNYDKKMYFDVLIDDKAGFDPEIDWFSLNNVLIYQQEL